MQAWRIAKFVNEYGAALAVLIMGAVSVAGTRSWIAAAVVLSLAGLGLPQLRNALVKIMGPWPTMWLLSAVSLVLLAVFAWVNVAARRMPPTVAQQRVAIAASLLTEDVRSQRRKEYSTRKEEIIATAKALMAVGKVIEAAATLAPYEVVTDDDELHQQMHSIKVALALAQFESADQLPLAERAEVLGLVAQMQPKNRELEKRARDVARQWAASLVSNDIEGMAEARLETIRLRTASGNGAHRGVVAMVMAGIGEPSRFEHVSTEYRLTGYEVTVHMSYRVGSPGAETETLRQVVARLGPQGEVKAIEHL